MAYTNRSALSGWMWAALILTVIGAINWGLIGLFDFNLVTAIFGAETTATRVIYTLVGLAGLGLLISAATMSTRPPMTTTRTSD